MADPYQSAMFSGNPYYAKSEIEGRLVVVLQGRLENRGLELISQISRCVLKNEIHELIATDETGVGPGSKVERVAYLGFVEITRAGVLTIGDEVRLNNQPLGTIAGFDETHMPNHINIVISTAERRSGAESGFSLGDGLVFRQVKAAG